MAQSAQRHQPTPTPLQDLTSYKKYRNKAVSSAARGLIALFRELAPGMLEKRDRGRGADMGRERMQYGAAQVRGARVVVGWVGRAGGVGVGEVGGWVRLEGWGGME